MKKFFVLFLALTFVLSMGTFVFADDGGADSVRSGKTGSSVTIGGDARVRGNWKSNYNMNDNTDVDDRWWDQRVRFNIVGKVGNGVEVRTRLTSGTDYWASSTSGTISVDYMYLHIPVGNFVIDVGNMHRNWGNKLLIWDQGRDTFQVTTNVGDTQIGLYTDKIDDSRATVSGSENLEDDNNYGVFVNHSAGNLAAGLLVIFEKYKYNSGSAAQSGAEASLYLNTSVGAISIASEFSVKRGELNKINNDSPSAGFIYVATDVGAINVSLFGAILKDGYVADSHLTPTVFLGTDNPTALADVQADQNSTTKAVVLGASTDISSDLSVRANLAWYDLENLGTELGGSDTGNEKATEIDLGLTYKIADNTTLKVDFGYFMPDNITTQDDNAMALSQKIEVKF